MERTVRVFDDFEQADAAEWEDYRSLAPQERLDILLTLIANYVGVDCEDQSRLERVYRVTELG